MDFFGIGSAVKACSEIYFNSARQTGRTTALIHSLKAGDRVYLVSHAQCDWFKRRLKDAGIEGVECRAWSKNVEDNFRHGKAAGKVVIDHDVVQDMYQFAIDECARRINRIESDLSTHSRLDEVGRPEVTVAIRSQASIWRGL